MSMSIPEPVNLRDEPEPRPGEASQGGREDEFWAVPGVERPGAQASATGAAPVGDYVPASTPTTRAIEELLGQINDLGEAVAALHAAAGRVAALAAPPGGAGSATAEPAVLDHLTGLTNVKNTIDATIQELVRVADAADIARTAAGLTLGSWFGLKTHVAPREASRLILTARRARRFQRLRAAALAGAVSARQLEVAAKVLCELPADLDPAQLAKAEELLVGRAGALSPDQLAGAGEEILESVAPQIAQQSAEDKAARQLKRAERARYLSVRSNFDGTATIRGLLPIAEGELVRAVIERAAEKTRRDLARTPGAAPLDRGRARADALVEIIKHVQSCGRAAPLGTTGARLVVTIQAADLMGAGAGAHADAGSGAGGRIAGSGERLAAAAMSILACDSDVTRVLVGAKGEILDVGRTTRMVPKGIKTALAARDKGCVFPGCDRPVEVCHAHHVKPWRRGGPTRLSNLCTLCPTHHRLVEPPRDGPPAWQPRLRDDGLWEFIPPPWFDSDQKPLLHHRFAKATPPPPTPPTPAGLTES